MGPANGVRLSGGAGDLPVELRAVGQGGESASQTALGVAVEVSLAGESRPAGEDREGNDLALGKGGLGAGASLLGAVGLAKVIDDDVECGEEGVHVEHRSVPFPSGSGGKPTLRRGRLPLKSSPPNSHQAFKHATPCGLTQDSRIGPVLREKESARDLRARLGTFPGLRRGRRPPWWGLPLLWGMGRRPVR